MLTCTGSSCRHAVSPGCECGCGGGNHGALARLAWAAALTVPAPQRTSDQNQQVVTAAAQRSRATSKVKGQENSHRRSRKKPRRADATAFFESTRTVDIVDWLVANPSEREKIQWMARQVGDVCEQVLTQHPGTHARLADHFWCDGSLLWCRCSLRRSMRSISSPAVSHSSSSTYWRHERGKRFTPNVRGRKGTRRVSGRRHEKRSPEQTMILRQGCMRRSWKRPSKT